jgi:hypothetical protein
VTNVVIVADLLGLADRRREQSMLVYAPTAVRTPERAPRPDGAGADREP